VRVYGGDGGDSKPITPECPPSVEKQGSASRGVRVIPAEPWYKPQFTNLKVRTQPRDPK
jgi:hypothetical protein